jgi:PAS domain S-box-containing protein
MEPIMATASILQVNSPLANTHATSGIPEVRSNDLATFTLDDLGIIRDCSRACEPIFGYMQEALVGRHISMLLPQLANTELVQEGRINSHLNFLCHCAFVFQARRRDGQSFTSELFINRLDTHNVVVLVRNLGIAKSMGGIHAVNPVQ